MEGVFGQEEENTSVWSGEGGGRGVRMSKNIGGGKGRDMVRQSQRIREVD
jgi:hypothetical protein